ncbi:dimethylarginine dimethylaminohydrolase family protein [Legionella feeleii]|uniref:arginine deiminase n=2 Tax=Legionella feeleii TaxID=453 RepID=A0A0W0TJC7_9GAMM|nr:arginine deiminase-related protein [Legionella feeleii]KTC95667.1 NG,NG-dimethylarginine dimethylaminohydrolase [Legionella feeleii]
MCNPQHYGIFYEINPWMHVDIPVVQTRAKTQWQALYETLLKLNVNVKLIEPINGLPDMVFTANAGFIYRNQVWVSAFKSHERQPESEHFKDWFSQEGFEIVNIEYDLSQPPAFEGAGDTLVFNNCLAAGYGFRSDISVYEHPFFKQLNLVFCELINPYFYHLDTCFCPLNSSLALWYPDAFSQQSQRAMRKIGQLIDVPEDEARRFACNAVVIGQHVILPSDCPVTYRLLESHGFIVHPCDMNEFIKSGGACKCLTLHL